MIKFLTLSLLCMTFLFANGQYQSYPKLESLYLDGKYDKCLEKAEQELQSNQREIVPHIWQLRCYLAIDESETHPLKKNALGKALNYALKIVKKDKEKRLIVELKNDFEIISERNIIRISALPESQYNNGMALFEKLKMMNGSLSLEYSKYQFMKQNNDINAFTILKNLVINHYSQFAKKVKPLENMEKAYASLIEEYYLHNNLSNARDVFNKANEIYPKSIICKNIYLDHLNIIASGVDYSTDESSLSDYIKECRSADSIYKDIVIQTALVKLLKYRAVSNIRFHMEDKKNNLQSLSDYLYRFAPEQYDSANSFFNQLLADNMTENLNMDKTRIFDYWIISKMEIKKQKQAYESIKSIHQYLIKGMKYETDISFLSHCSAAYPQLKPAIQLLQKELDKEVLAYISNPDTDKNMALIDEYIKKTNNKVLKEKKYQIYIEKLTDLLNAGHFSGFAVNIVKALNQYPDDPRLLSLKKQWVINDYKANYVTTSSGYEQYFLKLPNELKCEPGIVNKAGHAIVLQKINYCRRLAGAPDSCIFDEALNVKCQKAALMMSANGSLSHAPPKQWKCYTPEGSSGAGASNLSLGHAFHHALMGQMEDDGTYNTACGHRRWILNPYNTVFGHGSSMNATSIYVFGTGNEKLRRKLYFNEKQALCWPSTDYFPIDLIPQRWSFSLADVNFEKAKVTVTAGGKVLPVMLEPLSYGYGENTLVWVITETIKANQAYIVTISNIMPYTADKENTKSKTYTYQVLPIEIN